MIMDQVAVTGMVRMMAADIGIIREVASTRDRHVDNDRGRREPEKLGGKEIKSQPSRELLRRDSELRGGWRNKEGQPGIRRVLENTPVASTGGGPRYSIEKARVGEIVCSAGHHPLKLANGSLQAEVSSGYNMLVFSTFFYLI